MVFSKFNTMRLYALLIVIVICMIGNDDVSAATLRGKAEPLMNRPGQMMGIPSPEGSNFFHPDGLPTWMRPSALPEKFRSPAVPSGGGAMVPGSMPVAPAMGINGDAYQNPGQLPNGVPSAGLGGMYGSPVGHNQGLGQVSTAVAPGLPGGAGVTFK
eukprot:g6791.t1